MNSLVITGCPTLEGKLKSLLGDVPDENSMVLADPEAGIGQVEQGALVFDRLIIHVPEFTEKMVADTARLCRAVIERLTEVSGISLYFFHPGNEIQIADFAEDLHLPPRGVAKSSSFLWNGEELPELAVNILGHSQKLEVA